MYKLHLCTCTRIYKLPVPYSLFRTAAQPSCVPPPSRGRSSDELLPTTDSPSYSRRYWLMDAGSSLYWTSSLSHILIYSHGPATPRSIDLLVIEFSRICRILKGRLHIVYTSSTFTDYIVCPSVVCCTDESKLLVMNIIWMNIYRNHPLSTFCGHLPKASFYKYQ